MRRAVKTRAAASGIGAVRATAEKVLYLSISKLRARIRRLSPSALASLSPTPWRRRSGGHKPRADHFRMVNVNSTSEESIGERIDFTRKFLLWLFAPIPVPNQLNARPPTPRELADMIGGEWLLPISRHSEHYQF